MSFANVAQSRSNLGGAGGHDRIKQDALAQMDLIAIMRAYILAIVEEAQGYKALVVDKETMRIASVLFGRTELAEHNVVHIEKLDGEGKEHPELKAICFLRPTRENITLLKRELKASRYQSYYFFFTNLLSSIHLQELAEADSMKEQVVEVQEFYGDFMVLDSHHFTIPCAKNELLICPRSIQASGQTGQEYELIDRFVQGLSALFLAIRRRPVIRYQRGSDNAQRLADSLYQLTYKQQYQVFDFGARSNPIVLILDRKDDPVTPLLTQWTYQAMLHEMIGINDNTIKLTSPKVPQDALELVLDPRQDEFYRKHIYANYGEVGNDVKTLVMQFQSTSEKHKNVDSLADMRRFVSEHENFQKLQGNVTKHVNVMTQLSEAIAKRNLMEVSMAEQELANPATSLTAAASYEEITRILRQPLVANKDKVRLVMLYALRFESDALRVRQLMDFLSTAGLRDSEPKLFAAVDAVLRYAGSSKRAGDLYGTRSIMNKARGMFKGLQDVENVYTQHTPLLTATLTMLSNDKLESASYPYMASSQDEALAYQAAFKRSPPREVIVFVLGGSTYEESRNVAEWNERNPHMRVILGGSAVLNSDMFLSALASNMPGGGGGGGVDTDGLR